MGYAVQKLEIRSLDDNKKYKINLPDDELLMKNWFEELIAKMSSIDLNDLYQSNIEKCKKCIYEDAYDRSLNMGDWYVKCKWF